MLLFVSHESACPCCAAQNKYIELVRVANVVSMPEADCLTET